MTPDEKDTLLKAPFPKWWLIATKDLIPCIPLIADDLIEIKHSLCHGIRFYRLTERGRTKAREVNNER